MKDWFQGLLDGVWEFFEFLWGVVSGAFEGLWSAFWDFAFIIPSIPIKIAMWGWDNVYTVVLQHAVDALHDLDINGQISQIELNNFNIGGLLVALVDWDYVIFVWGGLGFIFIGVAFFKFAIKFIPGIG